MQDRYAGDVGDFGKYALLNQLCMADGRGQAELTLGVLWYVPPSSCVDAESGTQGDGKHIGYLQPDKCRAFRQCAPDLWEKMRSVVYGHRSIAAVERSGALPAGTKYYSEPQVCGFPASHATKAEKKERRRIWLRTGREAVEGADLVFVDPDNGFQPKSVEPHHKKGPKYVHFGDLDAHVEAGQSLVVYHHLGRHKPHVTQVCDLLDTLSKRFELGESAFAVRYRRGSARAYFVLPNPKHSELLADRVQQLIDSRWGKGKHFDPCIYRPSPTRRAPAASCGITTACTRGESSGELAVA